MTNPAPDPARQGYGAPAWDIGRGVLEPRGRPLVMGIVNLTPDSFHAASRAASADAACRAALAMVEAGADLLDLGAESSRPGALPVDGAAERERLLPALEMIRARTDIPLSVDTVRAETARAALDAGADIINDISAGRHDPDLLGAAAAAGCGLVLMHMRGEPRTMQENPEYDDVVTEVGDFLAARVKTAVAAGVEPGRLAVDPGIGFGKKLEHNLALLANLPCLAGGRPLLLGASRKRFIGEITGADTPDRLPGSLAAAAVAMRAGAAVVRVHDVAATVQFLRVLQAVADRD